MYNFLSKEKTINTDYTPAPKKPIHHLRWKKNYNCMKNTTKTDRNTYRRIMKKKNNSPPLVSMDFLKTDLLSSPSSSGTYVIRKENKKKGSISRIIDQNREREGKKRNYKKRGIVQDGKMKREKKTIKKICFLVITKEL